MPSGSHPRPNIVLVMSDQHNPHVMRHAGHDFVQTPVLDALAGHSVQFTSAYCSAPLCVPSRMGFMTAQYPSDVGVWNNGSILSSSVPTFAHALGGAGYEAVICGRMHFGGPDQYHGFETRLYVECAADWLSGEIAGHGYSRTTGQTKYAVEVSGYGSTGYQAYDREVTRRACDFVRGRRADARPYCLVVGYVLPHNPLICSRELFEYYLERTPVPQPVSKEYLANLHPAIRLWRQRRGVDDLTPEQNHRGLAAYYGLVTELDRNIGQVVDGVRSSAQADNTVVIYCSDHGDMACEHGMWWKSCHFEGSARVPLIVSWPGRFPSKIVDAVVSLNDVGPTLLEIAEADPLPDVTGRSLAGFLKAGAPPSDWPNEVFCEYVGAHGDQPSCMVRSGGWKLMYYAEFGSCLLFNLQEDPRELRDRAGDPECCEVGEQLLARVHSRWSAQQMLEGWASQQRAQQVIANCGHPAIPHAAQRGSPPAHANRFDLSQVPHWEAIKQRVEAPAI